MDSLHLSTLCTYDRICSHLISVFSQLNLASSHFTAVVLVSDSKTTSKLSKLKHTSRKAEVPPICLLFKHSHSSGTKYFSRCLYIMFALVWMHFEVNFYISKPFGFSNIRRRWNRATSFGPCHLTLTLGIYLKHLHRVRKNALTNIFCSNEEYDKDFFGNETNSLRF